MVEKENRQKRIREANSMLALGGQLEHARVEGAAAAEGFPAGAAADPGEAPAAHQPKESGDGEAERFVKHRERSGRRGLPGVGLCVSSEGRSRGHMVAARLGDSAGGNFERNCPFCLCDGVMCETHRRMYELEVEESTVGSSAATMMAAAVYFADMEEYRKVWHSARSQAARAARKHGDGLHPL